MITETLAQIRAASFTAGIVLFDDVVVETAPIVRYMRKWSRMRVRAYCQQRNWKVDVVHEMQRPDVTAKGGHHAPVNRRGEGAAGAGTRRPV
jgi:hypothetical protein